MGTTRRLFTDEFKREAVELLASSGRPLSQIARELGIAASMLRSWRDAGDRGKAGSPPAYSSAAAIPPAGADLAAENARLRRENERLRMEREILKNQRGGRLRLGRRNGSEYILPRRGALLRGITPGVAGPKARVRWPIAPC
jgi:transposase